MAAAKLQGITMSPEEPKVFGTLLDILDYKPAYEFVALAAPIGLLDEPVAGGRQCDREARRILGFPRRGAVLSAPARSVLREIAGGRGVPDGAHLSAVSRHLVSRYLEVDSAMEPYWQRTVFEVHPEMGFYQLNQDRPLRYGKHTQAGIEERVSLLQARIPGVERVLEANISRVKLAHLVDGAICLWTARRIASRAVNRLPEDPEWDAKGLRMEIVR